MKELSILDEETQERLQELADILYGSGQVVVGYADEMMNELERALAPLPEKVAYFVDRFVVEKPDWTRPPVEIKRELKRAKNPLQIRELNKELNEAYKAQRRNKER